ncbi:hypothetical protein J2X77_002686 [Sphingobacterium sp. 2149]|nr:hypothetical protein [Sphingobacterium sp. 2149]
MLKVYIILYIYTLASKIKFRFGKKAIFLINKHIILDFAVSYPPHLKGPQTDRFYQASFP